MDGVILHEIAISLLSLSLPTHAYRLEISPRWQWPDLASISPVQSEEWDNPMTAGALARWILWNKETLHSSIQDYTRRFNLAAV